MKTYRNLYPQICDFENLYRAFRQARRGKRERAEVAEFENDLEFELTRLARELREHNWRPGRYRQFTLYERKPRRISAALSKAPPLSRAFEPLGVNPSRTR